MLKNVWERARGGMGAFDALLLRHPVNLYYLTGTLFDGALFFPREGEPGLFARRPAGLPGAVMIKSLKQIPALLAAEGVSLSLTLGLEKEEISAAEWESLETIFPDARLEDAGGLLRALRTVKTPEEQTALRESARRHDEVQREIPSLYRPGMTDWELAAAIEYRARLRGHLGIFRTRGLGMEGYLSSVLCGDNAGVPSPYDFSLGGQGAHPSAPFGPTGREMRPGETLMVDFSGNFTGYISDMTRTYAIGRIPPEAAEAHAVSRAILRRLEADGKPGVPCRELYETALQMVSDAGLGAFFMGRSQQARFVGHGVGLQINEAPVLSRGDGTPLAAGMTIALEPKFVLPGIGPAGVENTYLVTEDGLRSLHDCPEEIVVL